MKKPGTEQHGDIVVPSPNAGYTPDDDKKKAASKPSSSSSSSSSSSDSGSKKKGKKDNALDGLEL